MCLDTIKFSISKPKLISELYKIIKIMESENDTLAFKVILLGDGAVGKTSIRKKYMGKGFESSHLMTIGMDFSQKIIDTEGKTVRLQIWDIAGEENFSLIRKRLFSHTSGVLLVFDLTRKQSFDSLSSWLSELWEVNMTKNIPILIIGNKTDLAENRIISKSLVDEYLVSLKEEHGISSHISYIETSAKTGDNIEKGFDEIASEMVDIAYS